jgi:putative salt-induced outer membrane protein YdiY
MPLGGLSRPYAHTACEYPSEFTSHSNHTPTRNLRHATKKERAGLPSYFFPRKVGVLPILKTPVERCIVEANVGAVHIRLECEFQHSRPDHVADASCMGKSAVHIALIVVAVLSCGSPLLAKRSDDLVVMTNGDRFTGEIKKLENGILYFKSGYMLESVQLDWAEVDRLESQDRFFITLKSGKRYTGIIGKTGGKKTAGADLRLATQGKVMEIEPLDVVGIQQSERTFWSQVNGSIDYGLSYSSGNSALSSSLGAAAEYQRTKDLVRLTTGSQFDTQSNGPSTNRYTFDGQYFRLLSERWLYGGLIDLLKSDRQQLDLRTTAGAVFGRTMLRTERTSLRIFAGTVFSRERYFPQEQTTTMQNNAEALIGANFYTFRFKVLDIRSSALFYPSLSDPGRYRLSSDSNLHIELVKDFYWDFHLYENFDSRPPIHAPRNDLGVTTGIGWKF